MVEYKNMKFKGEGWAGNVNLGGIGIQLVFKAMRPKDVSKRDVGRKEVKTRTDPQAPPTVRGPGDEEKLAKETRTEHPETYQEDEDILGE